MTDAGLAFLIQHCSHIHPDNIVSSIKSNLFLESVSKYRPKLNKIDLTECKGVTDESLAQVVSECSELRPDNVLSKLKGDLFCEAVAKHHAKGLTSINLIGCTNVTDAGLAKLMAACLELHPDKVLSDEDTKGDLFLAAVAKNHPRVAEIDLRTSDTVTDQGLALLMQGCPGLLPDKVLSLAKGNEFCKAVAEHRPKLTEIGLNDCEEVTDEGLAALITGCPDLLPSHAVSFAKGDLFCGAVAKQHPSLRAIDLRGCPNVTDEGVAQIVASCLKMTPSNILSLVKGDSFCEAVSNYRPDVVDIDFTGCSKLRLKAATGSDEEAAEKVETGPAVFDPTKKHGNVSYNVDRTVLNKNNTGWNDGTAVISNVSITIPKAGEPVPKKTQRWSCRFDKGGAKGAFGVVTDAFDCTKDGYVGKTENGWGFFGEAKYGHKTKTTGYGEKYTDGDVIDVEVDAEECTLRFFKNGVDQGVATKELPRDTTYLGGVSLYNKGDKATLLPTSDPKSSDKTGVAGRSHGGGFYNITPGGEDDASEVFFNTKRRSRRVQSIYTASDIVVENGRVITAIQLLCVNPIENALENFRVEYALTKESSLEQSWLPTTPCFGPKTVNPDDLKTEGEWSTFDLSEPIIWDGVSNLVVQYSFNDPDAGERSSCDGVGAVVDTKEDGRSRIHATNKPCSYPFDDESDAGKTSSEVPHLRLKFRPMVSGDQAPARAHTHTHTHTHRHFLDVLE